MLLVNTVCLALFQTVANMRHRMQTLKGGNKGSLLSDILEEGERHLPLLEAFQRAATSIRRPT